MKFDMDYIAHNNELTEFNPYIKLFVTIILLIVTLAVDNLYFDVIVFVVMSIIILAIAKINYKSYLKFLSIPMAFLVITCIFLLFFCGIFRAITCSKRNFTNSGYIHMKIRKNMIQYLNCWTIFILKKIK